MTREEVHDLLERVAVGDEVATATLLRILSEEAPATQVLFIDAIQNADDADLWEQLILTLADEPAESPPRRAPAAVGSNRDPRDVPADEQLSEAFPQPARAPRELLEALTSPKRTLRVQAALALGETGDPTAVEPLVRALGDDRLVAGAAQRALETIGPAATAALVEALKDRNDQVRWHAARALAAIRDPRAIPAQIEALNDPNYGVRWLAAEGLAAEGPEALLPLLETLSTRKPTAWLRQGAAHVLTKVAVPDPLLRDELRTLAGQIKRGPAADIPVLARAFRQRLLHDGAQR